jgi:hypothetical protein
MTRVGFEPTIPVFERGEDSSYLRLRGHYERRAINSLYDMTLSARHLFGKGGNITFDFCLLVPSSVHIHSYYNPCQLRHMKNTHNDRIASVNDLYRPQILYESYIMHVNYTDLNIFTRYLWKWCIFINLFSVLF